VWVLRDRPAKAEWLTEAEKTALQGQLDIDNGGNREADHVRVKEILKLTFTNRTIITLAVVVFGANTAGYAIGYFLPAMIAEYGFAPSMVGWIVAIPSLGSIIVAGLWGYLSDHAKRREVVVSVGFMGLIVALVCMVVLQGPVLVVIAVTAANIFLTGAVFAFWPLPTLTIHPDVRPAGIAAVNSFGALGGVVSPIVFGIVHDATGSYDIAILVLAGFALLSGLLVLTVRVHNHLANKEFVNTEI
jgi:ACS family tartrate transporter-like MFS transporter